MDIAERISRLAQDNDVRVGTAESLTSGAIAVRLGAAPDASEWFSGGVVAYDSEVKFTLLGVDRGPVITARCAQQMAEGALRVLGTDIAVAVTGSGGPGSEEGQDAGTVFLAVATASETRVDEHHFSGDPTEVVEKTVAEALAALEGRLSNLIESPSADVQNASAAPLAP